MGTGQQRNRRYTFGRGALMALASVTLLTACAALPAATTRRPLSAEHARLDQDIQRARQDLGVPVDMLQPILDQERRVAPSAASADASYATLDEQVLALDTTSQQTLKAQTAADIEAFSTLLARMPSQTSHPLDTFQQALAQDVQSELSASTPGDFATIDTDVRSRLAALAEMQIAQRRLRALDVLLVTAQTLGVVSPWQQALAMMDTSTFTQGTITGDFTTLEGIVDEQSAVIVAGEADTLRARGTAALKQARSDVAAIPSGAPDAHAAEIALGQDAARLTNARTRADYLALAGALNAQLAPLAPALLRGQVSADYQRLTQLVSYGQTKRTLDPFTGGLYPAAYEYANADRGEGAALRELTSARSVEDLRKADEDINILAANLRALLDNMRDSTQPGAAHKTDLRLLQLYGLTSGKVMVVSLREQTARLYVDGRMIAWTYVTTGRPERPTPPGLHFALKKYSPISFASTDPPGSPYWFAPTPVKYAIAYVDGGFYLHDGWWRDKFGPGTNLPHYAPIAFNGGSHGCINFPKEVMGWIYDWMPVGTPVLVY